MNYPIIRLTHGLSNIKSKSPIRLSTDASQKSFTPFIYPFLFFLPYLFILFIDMIISSTKTFKVRCLLNGRGVSSAFTVRISSKFDVEDLRSSIKTSSRTTDFNNIELVDIRLRKMLIPDAPSPSKDVKERRISKTRR